MQAEELAQQFHEIYERLAPDFGYKTREASAKPWSEVPEQNKGLMIAVAGEILKTLSSETAVALVGFMGWLTSRYEVSGPFSACHDAAQAARLVGKFCDAQGWKVDDAQFHQQINRLKTRYPSGGKPSDDRPTGSFYGHPWGEPNDG